MGEEGSELELGNDGGCCVAESAFVLSFAVDHHSYFCASISFHVIDAVSSKGETTHFWRDLVLRKPNPGLKSQHAISFFPKYFKPLYFPSLCVSEAFGGFDVWVV